VNTILSITFPDTVEDLLSLCDRLSLAPSTVLLGHGTASPKRLQLLGIETRERRVVLTTADEKRTAELIRAQRRKLYIDTPGNGVVIVLPMKSVGGGKTLAYLNGGTMPAKEEAPDFPFANELIVAIANEGHTDEVMTAARSAGAGGGTILHGKGTGQNNVAKFYNVSLATEKEVVLIVVPAPLKNGIMSAILQHAGPASPAGTLVFSLPVSRAAGFGLSSPSED